MKLQKVSLELTWWGSEFVFGPLQTDRESERETQTDSQIETKTNTNIQTNKQTDRQTDTGCGYMMTFNCELKTAE